MLRRNNPSFDRTFYRDAHGYYRLQHHIAIFISIGTGIIFGIYPAARVADVAPIIALRL
jgi:hypothetical protein